MRVMSRRAGEGLEKELRLGSEAWMDRESVGRFKGSREKALRLHREVDILSMSQLCVDSLATLARYAVEVPMRSTKGRSGDPRFCEGKVKP